MSNLNLKVGGEYRSVHGIDYTVVDLAYAKRIGNTLMQSYINQGHFIAVQTETKDARYPSWDAYRADGVLYSGNTAYLGNLVSVVTQPLVLSEGKFYRTNDGKKIKIVMLDRVHSTHPALGVDVASGNTRSYKLNGEAWMGTQDNIVREWTDDVVVEGWANLYPYGSNGLGKVGQEVLYKTESEAKAYEQKNCVGQVFIKAVKKG